MYCQTAPLHQHFDRSGSQGANTRGEPAINLTRVISKDKVVSNASALMLAFLCSQIQTLPVYSTPTGEI